MMTAIALLQTLGAFVVGMFARAALILAVIAVVSVPVMAFAYGVRAIEGFRSRHHAVRS